MKNKSDNTLQGWADLIMTKKDESSTSNQQLEPCPRLKYPLRVESEPGYEGVACILDSNSVLVAAMMHPRHAEAVVATLNQARGSAGGVVATVDETPVDMLLFCPNCRDQHVDAPESETDFRHKMEAFALVAEPQDRFPSRWTNPPHRSHLCHKCGAVWRPADVPTNGVAKISTAGTRDTWMPCPATASPAAPVEQPRRIYGWILGSQYQEWGYYEVGDEGAGGEPWYVTAEGQHWSAFDVEFFPVHEFHGVSHPNDEKLLLCDFIFHGRRCDKTKERHDSLVAPAAPKEEAATEQAQQRGLMLISALINFADWLHTEGLLITSGERKRAQLILKFFDAHSEGSNYFMQAEQIAEILGEPFKGGVNK